jgi:hypothetical protein
MQYTINLKKLLEIEVMHVALADKYIEVKMIMNKRCVAAVYII